MSVCTKLKGYSRNNERIADFFSLMSVAMLFGTVWIVMQYYSLVASWVLSGGVLYLPLVFAAVLLDVFCIFLFLDFGSSRLTEEGEEDRCFQTFRGRRTGSGSILAVVSTWVNHMEHVNKQHG